MQIQWISWTYYQQSGFIVMGINCILIELYFEMINGFDTSDESGHAVLDAYTTILPMLDADITIKVAKIFYKGIRCKIIHQGQTGLQTVITYDSIVNKIIVFYGDYNLCNEQIQELSNMGENEQVALLKEFVDTELVPGNLSSSLNFDESFENWKNSKRERCIYTFAEEWGLEISAA